MKWMGAIVGLIVGLDVGAAVFAQSSGSDFRTRLTTVAFATSQGALDGDGEVSATLDGKSIKVQGHYSGLASPATRVRVLSGVAVGVPGEKLVAEFPAGQTSGEISGELPASAASLLKAQRLYVQIDTQAAPGGAIWGWLMASHSFPGAGVPEKQNWYATAAGGGQ